MWDQQGCNPTGSVAHVVWFAVEGMTNRQQPWAHRQGQRETARTSKSKQKRGASETRAMPIQRKSNKKRLFLFFGVLACPLKNDQHLLDQQAGTKREKEQAKVSKKRCI